MSSRTSAKIEWQQRQVRIKCYLSLLFVCNMLLLKWTFTRHTDPDDRPKNSWPLRTNRQLFYWHIPKTGGTRMD